MTEPDAVTTSRAEAVRLAGDVARKSGLVWLAFDGSTHPAWHEWVGDAVCVVAGGDEQPVPRLADQSTVTVLLRAKSTRHVVAAVEADVHRVRPGDEHWDEVTGALKAGRLNLADGDTAIARWAKDSVVVRLVPVRVVDVPPRADQAAARAPRLS